MKTSGFVTLLLFAAVLLQTQSGGAQIIAYLKLCELAPGADCTVGSPCNPVQNITICPGQNVCFMVTFPVQGVNIYTVTIGQSGGGPNIVHVGPNTSSLWIRFGVPVLPGGSTTTFTLLSITDTGGNVYDVSQSLPSVITVLQGVSNLGIAQSGQSCFNNPVSLSASSSGSNNTYVWSNGATGAGITVTSSGQYTVTASSADGCTATASTTITYQIPQPITFSIAGPICAGQAITVTAFPASGVSYVWSNGTSGPSSSFILPAIVAVTGTTASGCSGAYTVNYAALPPPPLVEIIGATAICPNQNATLMGTGSYNAYLWSTGNASSSISVNAAGTYAVTVTNASGCTGSATTILSAAPLPSVTFSGTTDICAGSCQDITVTFTGTPPFNLTYTSPVTGPQSQIFNTITGTLQICPPAGTPPGALPVNALALTDLNCTCQ